MTTIAYRDGVLAGDSLYIRGGWKMGTTFCKVFKTPDGRLLGLCGDAAHAMKLVEWLKLPPKDRCDERPALDKDAGTVVEVLRSGKARFYEHNHFHDNRERYWSVGSGSVAALVAMDMGANATRAVKAAIRRDDSSGGPVRSVKIRDD